MFETPRFVVMLIFVLVFLLVVTAKQSRRHTALTEQKRCRQCGSRFGAEANYCGRCGRAL